MTKPVFKYRLLIAYDGTNYSGWQTQPQSMSIQQKLEEAIAVLTKEPVRVIGSGRTDAGVHAHNQVAHFQSTHKIDTFKALVSINGLLPYDIRVKEITLAESDFHACHSATGKIYHYHCCLGQFQDPSRRFYSYHVKKKIDLSLLKKGAAVLVGTHNFLSFANSGEKGSASRNPVRTIRRLDVVQEGDEQIRLEFEGDGFLYKMVRNMTGILLDVASEARPLTDIKKGLRSQDRREASMAAPPQGLFLVKVYYE